MCVREKFSLRFKNHCVGCCSPGKRDHRGQHAKNEDKSPSGETEQCESPGTARGVGAASRPLWVLPSHMTRRSRQSHVHHPLCQLRAHSAGRFGSRRPSPIRSKADGLQTTCCRQRSCTCSTEHQETASQLNGLIIIDRLIMKGGGGGERGSQERAVTEF